MLYGFLKAHKHEPAWFHTVEAARRFAEACGWWDADITTIEPENVLAENILDSPTKPWAKE